MKQLNSENGHKECPLLMELIKSASDSFPEKHPKTWKMSKQYTGIKTLLITSATLQFPCRLVPSTKKYFLVRDNIQLQNKNANHSLKNFKIHF